MHKKVPQGTKCQVSPAEERRRKKKGEKCDFRHCMVWQVLFYNIVMIQSE